MALFTDRLERFKALIPRHLVQRYDVIEFGEAIQGVTADLALVILQRAYLLLLTVTQVSPGPPPQKCVENEIGKAPEALPGIGDLKFPSPSSRPLGIARVALDCDFARAFIEKRFSGGSPGKACPLAPGCGEAKGAAPMT